MRTIIRGAAIAAAVATTVAAPVAAKDKPPVFVESAAVKDKPAVVIDPTKAYVLLRSEAAVPMYLMKLPTAADQAAYAKLRADAFVEARDKYAKKFATWQRDKDAAAKSPGLKVGEKPVEPTEANFQFTPFELMAAVGIGPVNRFAKKDGSTYLHEVTPGTYRVYGFLSAVSGAAPIGTCFCMGSISFDAKAGEITDLGVVGKAEPAKAPSGDSSYPVSIAAQPAFAPASALMAIDPRLANVKRVPARFHASGKMPNYFGLTITRMPEMPGVLRYDRDRIVDLSAGG